MNIRKLQGYICYLLLCSLSILKLEAQVNPMIWEDMKMESIKALHAGRYYTALTIAEDALRYSAQQPNSKHFYFEGLLHLATLYERMGNYTTAIAYMEKRFVFAKEKFIFESLDYMRLAELYMKIADWKRAKQQLDILKLEIRPPLSHQPRLHAKVLTLLAEVQLKLGEKELAVQSFEAAAKIYLKLYGNNHIAYADALNRVVYASMAAQDYQKAFFTSEEVLRLWGKLKGQKSPIYAFTLNNIGIAAQHLTRKELAEFYYKKSLEIYQQVYSENHPNCVSIQNNLGILYEQQGQTDKAKILLQGSTSALLQQISDFYKSSSEIDRLHFYRLHIANNIDAFYSFVSRQQDSLLLVQMQEISLKTKNASTESSINLKHKLLSNATPDLMAQYKRWYQLRLLISQAYSLSPDEIQHPRNNVAQLEVEALALERKIAMHVATTPATDKVVLNTSSIQKKLGKGEVSIDFIHFHYRSTDGWTDSIRYYALLNRYDQELPILVPLCDEKQLRSVMRRTVGRDPFNGRLRNSYVNNHNLNERLYKLVWKPLSTHLKGIESIHLAPTGWLYQLAFDALLDPKTKTALMDRYQLHYYATMRDFVEEKRVQKGSFPKQALLLGGIDFNANFNENSFIKDTITQSVRTTPKEQPWSSLPESLKEVETVTTALQKAGYNCITLSSDEAREDSLKNYLITKPLNILHIATHGYFIPTHQITVPVDQIENFKDKLAQERHPLWRSGFLLAGANRSWQGNNHLPSLMDGIVPAYDIAAMNLFDTELVVLSACQTGRGDIDDIEGVQGLQSAFKQAGVQYQLLTLWEVSDGASAKMMELFYKHYLMGKPIYKAFRAARMELKAIEEFRAAFYWAAFILIE